MHIQIIMGELNQAGHLDESLQTFEDRARRRATFSVVCRGVYGQLWEAFEAQRQHTQLAGAAIFHNPATGAPWPDEKQQRLHWKRCLRKLGLRYREPYQTRHTFATLALMAGANPAWVARQLGHVKAHMLFRVYAKWIDGADKSRERDKLNAVLGHGRATELAASLENAPTSRTSVAERQGATLLREIARGASNTPVVRRLGVCAHDPS